jgi:hypothetical protein
MIHLFPASGQGRTEWECHCESSSNFSNFRSAFAYWFEFSALEAARLLKRSLSRFVRVASLFTGVAVHYITGTSDMENRAK